jgi:hypothetical protein
LSPSRPLNYPHLLPEDAKLWNDYLEQFSPPHTTFMYDVAVGPGRDPGDSFDDPIRKMALQLSKRRIDVVGILPDGVEIFELTQSAGLKAAGQAIVYPHLLKVTWNLSVPVTTTIICRSCQDDIQPVLDTWDIRLVVIPATNHA